MAQTFDSPITTMDQSVDRVLAAGLPVLFVFLDGPANAALDESMQRLAKENAGRMLVVKVHLKDSPNIRNRYGIHRAPAVVTVSDKGQVMTKAEGISASDLARHAAYLLGKGPKPEEPRPATDGSGAGPARAAGAGPSPATAAEGKPRPVTDATFDQEVLRSPRPVVVDFWAPWCGPCRMVEPVVEKMAAENAGRVDFVKVNVDENPAIAGRYGVQSIPTMMVVKNGQIVDRWAGALPEPAMRSRLAPHLGV